MSEIRNYQRGDIFLATLEPRVGSEQGGTRPVIVLLMVAYSSPTPGFKSMLPNALIEPSPKRELA